MSTSNNNNLAKKNKVTLKYLLLLTLCMFGFGFAMVPFYNLLCEATGLNGKTSGYSSLNTAPIDVSRTIIVQFLATDNSELPWTFIPLIKQVTVYPGENKEVAFYAKNNSGHTMTVQAIPSVTPGIAAKYLRKTECFCFQRQTFKNGEARDMPVLFHLDQSLPDNIHTVTISYTLFDTSKLKYNNGNTPGKINF